MSQDTRAWCPFWGAEQRAAFLAVVETEAEARWGAYELDDDLGYLRPEAGDVVLILSQVASACAGVEPEGWAEAVKGHTDEVERLTPKAVLDMLADYDQARPHLRLRVVGAHQYEGKDVAGRELPFGMRLALSVDLAGSAAYVMDDWVGEWGVDLDQAMDDALANTKQASPIDHENVTEHKDGWREYKGASMFVSGNLADLDHAFPDLGEHGAIVAVPAADTLLVLPVEPGGGGEWVRRSASIMSAAFLRYVPAPNPVLPATLWWRGGGRCEPYSQWRGDPSYDAPAELIKMVYSPAGDQGRDEPPADFAPGI